MCRSCIVALVVLVGAAEQELAPAPKPLRLVLSIVRVGTQ
jgi:hypothetical protein